MQHLARLQPVSAPLGDGDQATPGEQRDRAAEAIARGIVNRDAEAAREWAESIADGALRATVIEEIEREMAP